MSIVSVTELTNYLKQYIENNVNLSNLSIKGEISNLVYHHTGHIYFTIKDNSSQIKSIMFNSYAKNLKFKLQEGHQVVIKGSIKIYAPQGRYTLQATEILLDGLGELYVKYEKLKKELADKGWFSQSLKKPIPKFPKNIGIITASTGAAVRDIITTIKRRYPIVNLYLFPCLVQGKEAKNEIVKKINEANNFYIKLDCLIIGRGGGSIEDLWAFNEIEVVKAIYLSKIPIISAVGHEIDFTLSDFVSDVRAPTPTAAGELVTPDYQELKIYLQQEYRNLIKLIKQYVFKYQEQYNKLSKFYLLTNPNLIYQKQEHFFQNTINKFINIQQNFFYWYLQQINNWKNKLNVNLQKQIYNKEQEKYNLILKLDLLSPLKTLSRGYSIAWLEHQVITSTNQLRINNEVKIRLCEGQFTAKVTEIEE